MRLLSSTRKDHLAFLFARVEAVQHALKAFRREEELTAERFFDFALGTHKEHGRNSFDLVHIHKFCPKSGTLGNVTPSISTTALVVWRY